MRSEPVVMVHGWGGSFLRTWQEPGWEALLADAGRDVIGVDLLGHGTADKPHDPEAYADLTPAVTDRAPRLMPVDAIGFSLGSMTLLELACRAPRAPVAPRGVGRRQDAVRHRPIRCDREGRRGRCGRGRHHGAGVRAVRIVPGQRPQGARRVHAATEDRDHARAARGGHVSGARRGRRARLRRIGSAARRRATRRASRDPARAPITSPLRRTSGSSTPRSSSSTPSPLDRLSDDASATVAVHTQTAPAMWKPTSSTGTPVKYCV